MTFPIDADELLARVPAQLHETPFPELEGDTPAMAARHIRLTGCDACRNFLQTLIIKGEK
ncbi:hypothetical protein NIIDNTM18_42740 [Mycolicibacterium litorale]|uniref:Uncharacterized protein n=1 Tax=Mycolicibacterium litorale TaxID=758802 RepID=A0A6S6PAI1_9MYCO|nr:hypothetical protein NIIDNTM18_42740 [Mycolicibacterium litorale]